MFCTRCLTRAASTIWPKECRATVSKLISRKLVSVVAHDKSIVNGTRPAVVRTQTKEKPVSRSREAMTTDLATLSHSELIERCTRLEQQLASQAARVLELTDAARTANGRSYSPGVTPRKIVKEFDASRHSTRFIALKFSYLGHRYNGFEHANRCFTPLPTIEEVLWKALRKARLISPPIPEGADTSFDVTYHPQEREKKYYIYGKSRQGDETRQRLEISWEGCQYSKCGRTDRGVSAFAQVIGIRVRSNAPVVRQQADTPNGDNSEETGLEDDISDRSREDEHTSFDPIKDELPYVHMLNTILPPDVRILAWCPDPPEGFDARYSCLERRYKYFFTNPAFCPTPGRFGLFHADGESAPVREGWLDIARMREAAQKLEGTHDFRNLSQIDASKQMPNCQRRITFADVQEFDADPVDFTMVPELNAHSEVVPKPSLNSSPGTIGGLQVYAITVHGTAFLWHQIRCIAGILFLVGQGLETPDIIDKLLDISQMPGRPHYAMADDAPLVLWDCIFPSEDEASESGLKWVYAGDEGTLSALSAKGDGKFGPAGVVDELFSQWQEAKLKEAQIGGLLSIALQQGDGTSLQRGGLRDAQSIKARSQKVFEGGSKARFTGVYQPIMTRKLMDPLDVLNAKYLASVQGTRRAAKRSEKQEQAKSDTTET